MPIGLYVSQDASFSKCQNLPKNVIDRLTSSLMKKVNDNGHFAKRGNLVAADYIIDALLQSAHPQEYELVVQPWSRDAVCRNLAARRSEKNVEVTSITDLRLRHLEDRGISVLFNPMPAINVSEGIETTQRLRNGFHPGVLPFATVLHGLSLHRLLFDYFYRYIIEGTYPCDSFIATSKACRLAASSLFDHVVEKLREETGHQLEFNARIDQIPLTIDTERFKPMDKAKCRKELGLTVDSFTFVYLGKPTPLKGDLLPTLRSIADIIKNSQRQITCVFAGADEENYFGLLERYSAELGIGKRVICRRDISDSKKTLLLNSADVFVSPSDSLQESFGLSVIEAMACGIPQIVPDWDGYRDTVMHGETGFRVPTYWADCFTKFEASGSALGWIYDHINLAQAVAIDCELQRSYMSALVENESLRRDMAFRSRQRAIANYSYQAVSQQYRNLWQELDLSAASCARPRRSHAIWTYPKYHRCFHQHATESLDETTQLLPGSAASNDRIVNVVSRVMPELFQSMLALDESLLNDIVQGVRQATQAAHGVSCHGVKLADLFSEWGLLKPEKEDVLRHTLWLLKYGYLKCAPRCTDIMRDPPPQN